MNNHTQHTSTISSTYLQRNFGAVTRRVFINNEHIIVERDGLPIFALIPASTLTRLHKLEQREKTRETDQP